MFKVAVVVLLLTLSACGSNGSMSCTPVGETGMWLCGEGVE